VIARPPRTIPIPDAVALLAGQQLPSRVREAVAEAGLCGRLPTGRTLAACPAVARVEPAVRLHARLGWANKQLAACNPGLVVGWGDMPGLSTRPEGN
jgi:hypothetical protein